MAKINITQVRSRIGSTKLQKKNLDALGLRKMNRTVQHEDSPVVMGMVKKVKHLVTIELNAAPAARKETVKAKTESVAKTGSEKPEAKAAPGKEKATEPKETTAKKPATVKSKTPKASKPTAEATTGENDIKE